MVENNQLEFQIMNFVAEECGYKLSELSLDSSLFHNLGVDGIDAEDLIILFSERFKVDPSEFKFDLHFGEEAYFNPFLYFYWRFFKPEKLMKVPVTISDLIKSAEQHTWVKPTAEPKMA